jgi:hypothetical protein
MASGERRKCKGCHKLFRPDPRNRYHQRNCAAQSCRAASKAASQARWLAAPENQDYKWRRVFLRRLRAQRSRWRALNAAAVALGCGRSPALWRRTGCQFLARTQYR